MYTTTFWPPFEPQQFDPAPAGLDGGGGQTVPTYEYAHFLNKVEKPLAIYHPHNVKIIDVEC